jgi:ubiquitin-protein ligase
MPSWAEGVAMSGNARRLENDYRELREAFDGDPRVKIKALGTAPFDKYRIAYVGVPSLRQNQNGQPMMVEQTVVDIELPAGYPKLPLIAKTAAGDVVFHPNFNAEKICIADNWSAGYRLVDVVIKIGNMLQFTDYNILAPLNAVAAEWTQEHKAELPLANHTFGPGSTDISFN